VGTYGNDSYTYDVAGNRLTRSLVNGGATSTTYTYTSTNTQLAQAVTGSTTLKYAYDANGALLSRKLGNTTQQAYTYNDDGRLATVAGVTLKYNAFGQRQTSTVTGGGGIFIFGRDGLLLAEYTPLGVLMRNYIYLEGKPFAIENLAGDVFYILNDPVSQPQKMLYGSPAAVAWQRVAGIFGNTVSQPVGATSANPQRFPGQQEDPTSGLYYNYFRDYDPATGRYIEPDPIGLNGGINLYAYALGNPVSLIDPLGLWTGQLGLALNFQFGPVVVQFSAGLAIDGTGALGTYYAAGGGLGVGADVSGGVSVAYSPNACSIDDLNGPFNNVSLGGGWGPHASGDGFFGKGANGRSIAGAGITLGLGWARAERTQLRRPTLPPLGISGETVCCGALGCVGIGFLCISCRIDSLLQQCAAARSST